MLLRDVGLLLPVAGMVEAELIDALSAQHPVLADAPPTSSVSQETEAAVCSRVACSFPKTLKNSSPSLWEGDSINEGSWMGIRATKKSVRLNVCFL